MNTTTVSTTAYENNVLISEIVRSLQSAHASQDGDYILPLYSYGQALDEACGCLLLSCLKIHLSPQILHNCQWLWPKNFTRLHSDLSKLVCVEEVGVFILLKSFGFGCNSASGMDCQAPVEWDKLRCPHRWHPTPGTSRTAKVLLKPHLGACHHCKTALMVQV